MWAIESKARNWAEPWAPFIASTLVIAAVSEVLQTLGFGDFVPDDVIDRFCLFGPPEQHVERLRRQGVSRALVDGCFLPSATNAVARPATVSLGACDVAAVRYLLTEASLQRAPAAPIDVGELARYDRPLPSVADYDTLLFSTPCAGTA